MFAFIDSPVQLAVAMVVILIVFGPQKVPEIGRQLGKALRELKRATHEFSTSINAEDYDYKPAQYDSYGNRTPIGTEPAPENTVHRGAISAADSGVASRPEQPRGDFSASAMADTSENYGVAPPADPH